MDNRPLVAFHTLGCKLNQAETEHLALQFAEAGYVIATEDNADVCILNTCTVTHIADRKSRHMLRLLRKRNPNAFIVATGCYAEREQQKLMQTGIDLTVGNNQKMDLLKLIEHHLAGNQSCSNRTSTDDYSARVRSFIKIQDGCNDFCSYCIVPLVRGGEFCLPADEIISQINSRVAAGYKEVILTGTKIGTTNIMESTFRILSTLFLKRPIYKDCTFLHCNRRRYPKNCSVYGRIRVFADTFT